MAGRPGVVRKTLARRSSCGVRWGQRGDTADLRCIPGRGPVCVIDAARRPSDELSRGKKAAWVISSLLGWLLFGIVGAAVAAVYLIGPVGG